ncbi:uncharacterized protein K460DRAFT_112942 [Cucurbitaria berberidis CBS 394.84]|uniref:Uncharacterized protein n=1 Tax=Cucurbitaria berberidis CBS 394.84 TaxID=1168544 RepID=A0A9P4L855_9PLEO|nr:uncharacterized protein K460DRAFT_112942 [Cucurbitaria berberidis CBS 394.84]KAF1845675.1 hypothetical protein K460DRAFT_112942 [Cucurbitaria berberidis CBS 394.84]
MSSNPKKRQAKPDVFILAAKKVARASNVQPENTANKQDEVFQVSVKLHRKFDHFPAKLRTILETSYKDTIDAQMDTLQSGKQLAQRYTYSVLVGQLHLSLANMQLLEAFMGRNQAGLGKATFVELKTKEGLANAEFIHLHSVRHGELGWGFDTHGCLSLYSVSIVDSRLKEVVYFVERSEVKTEDEG